MKSVVIAKSASLVGRDEVAWTIEKNGVARRRGSSGTCLNSMKKQHRRVLAHWHHM